MRAAISFAFRTVSDTVSANSALQPPSNILAEQATLGAILSNNSVFHRVAGFLRPEMFADPIHQRLFKEIAKLIVDGELADAVALKHRLENSGILDEVGGTRYLAQLLAAMVAPSTAEPYARVIHDCWMRRQGLDIAGPMVDGLYGTDPSKTGEDVIRESAERLLAIISTGQTKDNGIVSIGDAVAKRIRQLDDFQRSTIPSSGLATGIPAIDGKLGLMQEGDLILLMAVRSAGKTAFALQVAINVARRLLTDWLNGGWERDSTARLLGDPNKMEDPGISIARCPCVLFDSYEQPQEQLSDRAIAYLTGLHSKVLNSKQWTLDVGSLLRQAELETKYLPLEIDDKRGQSAASMAIRGRMLKRRRPIALRITDHIQKVVTGSMGERDERNDVYRKISSRWKDEAAQWGRHLVLCHPRAETKRREGGAPQPGDALNGIDDDADIFLALHREEMFIPDEPPPKPQSMDPDAYSKISYAHWQRRQAVAGKAKVYCFKNRNGQPNWSVTLNWSGATTTFSDPSIESAEEPDSAAAAEPWGEFA
jgi:replicative DNA helicase